MRRKVWKKEVACRDSILLPIALTSGRVRADFKGKQLDLQRSSEVIIVS